VLVSDLQILNSGGTVHEESIFDRHFLINLDPIVCALQWRFQ